MFTVYMHINKINGKVYVGMTGKEPEQRWKNGLGYRGTRFWFAINKYGWDGFDHIIVQSNLTIDEAKALETKLILENNSHDRNFGYNDTYGGEHNIPTKEIKEKISKKMKGKFVGENNPFWGKAHTEDAKRIMREKTRERLSNPENNPFYGKHHSEYAKRIISEKRKGFILSEEHKEKLRLSNIGRHCTEEHKKLLSQLKKGVKRPDITGENNVWSKKVICCETGIVYPSISQASKENNCGVKDALSGKTTQAGGLHWLYYDDFKKMSREEVEKYVSDCIKRSHKSNKNKGESK